MSFFQAALDAGGIQDPDKPGEFIFSTLAGAIKAAEALGQAVTVPPDFTGSVRLKVNKGSLVMAVAFQAGAEGEVRDGWIRKKNCWARVLGVIETTAPTAKATSAPSDPFVLADYYLQTTAHDGKRTLVNQGEDLYQWSGGTYRPISSKAIVPDVTASIKESLDTHAHRMMATTGEPCRLPEVTVRMVHDTVNAIRARVRIPRDTAPPCWLDGSSRDPREYVPFRNGLLHLPSYLDGKTELLPPTPAYFTHHGLAFPFMDNAPPPVVWQTFLKSVWDDVACHELLHEWLGYVMSHDTSLQKLMALLGELRGGKGTTMFVGEELVGRNVAAQPLPRLVGEFGLQPLRHRQLLRVPDSRLVGSRVLADAAEVLKAITGEDTCTVNLKNKAQVTERLRIKVMIQSNDIIAFPDAVLNSRMLFLHYTKSFYGAEDTQLQEKLRPELPGIALLALAGLKRLYANGGKFTEPASSKQLAERAKYAAIPLLKFLDEHCEVAPHLAVWTNALFNRYIEWARANQEEEIEREIFGRQLRIAVPKVERTQKLGGCIETSDTDDKPDRPYYYIGLGLKKAS